MWWKHKSRAVDPRAHVQFLEQCLSTARNGQGHVAGDGTQIPIALKANERMLFAVLAGVALVEPQRGPGHWAGRSQGVSVHIPGTKSMRYRVGATKGTFVQGDERPTPVDTGSLTITNQRTVFVGTKATREWLWSKLVAIQHAADQPWTTIAVSNRQKTSGVLYDRAHEQVIRFFFDLAVARGTGGTDELIAHLESAIAAEQQALAPVGAPATAAVQAPAQAPAHQSPAAPAAAAGWYADPTGRFETRYWDGSHWTEHVARAGAQTTDPV